jgi:NAD(P)-dependent dehydrogenase (short-subunit alcohol dehydrogenase family)
MARSALIVGAGEGISASFARVLAREGMQVGLAARDPDKLAALTEEIGGLAFRCDVTEVDEVQRLFAEADDRLGALDVVHYNPSYRTQGALVDLDPAEVRQALMVSAFGGFLVAQQAAQRMLRQGGGAILFTGASASVKGYARSAPFAMGKFALRGLAQSMARELAPRNIHVAHFVIDGAVRSARYQEPGDRPDSIAGSGRHSRDLPRDPQAAAQRLDLGGRAPPLGRDLLTPDWVRAALLIQTRNDLKGRRLFCELRGRQAAVRCGRTDERSALMDHHTVALSSLGRSGL